jgi:hypothetical protein
VVIASDHERASIRLGERVASRLSAAARVHFRPYNANQFVAIFADRVRWCLRKGVATERFPGWLPVRFRDEDFKPARISLAQMDRTVRSRATGVPVSSFTIRKDLPGQRTSGVTDNIFCSDSSSFSTRPTRRGNGFGRQAVDGTAGTGPIAVSVLFFGRFSVAIRSSVASPDRDGAPGTGEPYIDIVLSHTRPCSPNSHYRTGKTALRLARSDGLGT